MLYTTEVAAGYMSLLNNAAIRPQYKSEVTRLAQQIVTNKSRYDLVSTKTGVPWWFIGIIHQMEAGMNFHTHLHNGDPLMRQGTPAKTVQVPKGRGPFASWEASAQDALTMAPHKLHLENDWSMAKVLYNLEKYNGWGYRDKGIASPYLWSYTDRYIRGKYVADGKYDPNAVSQQCGAVAMLVALNALGAIVPVERPQETVGADNQKVQARLAELGYAAVGRADGILGPRTESAIFAFQKQNSLDATGDLNPMTRKAIMGDAAVHAVSGDRATEGAASLAQAGDKTVQAGEALALTGKIAGGAAGAGVVLDSLDVYRGLGDRLTTTLDWVTNHLGLTALVGLAVVGFFVVRYAWQIIEERVRLHQNS